VRKAKCASFELFFLAEVQPVPAAAEVLPGMRPIELEGLTVQPKVMGQGEYKYQGFVYRAMPPGCESVGDRRLPAVGIQACPRIAFHKFGSHVRLSIDDLDAYAQAGRVAPITATSVRRDRRAS
jgi:hypothetical protein